MMKLRFFFGTIILLFSHCPINEAAVPTGCNGDPQKFTCSNGPTVCIDVKYVCNFVVDCPGGEDESPDVCVANPSYFDGTLEGNGWSAVGTNNLIWKTVSPSNVPASCKGACPTNQPDNKGGYAAADFSQSKTSYDTTKLTTMNAITATGPQCRLSFWYLLTEKSYVGSSTLALTMSTNTDNGVQRDHLWAVEGENQNQKWRSVTLFLGRRDMPFYLEFQAKAAYNAYWPAAAAVDYIRFDDCQELEPTPTCQPNQFRCEKEGTCIDPAYLCDFGDHCGDGVPGVIYSASDEQSILCDNSYVARCSYDAPHASCDDDWMAGEGDFYFRVSEAKTALSLGHPAIDHTSGSPTGRALLLIHSTKNNGKTARYKTTKRVVVASADDCRLRFWLYYYKTDGIPTDLGTLHVKARTSASPMVEVTLGTYDYFTGNTWLRQEISIDANKIGGSNKPFEIIFQGKQGMYPLNGGIAIDDVSLTPGCHLTDAKIPGQGSITTISPPTCDSIPGNYKCDDGNGCYSKGQHCNFMNDCDDGSDEIGCATSCTFDNINRDEPWCGWGNVCTHDGQPCDAGVNWKWLWFNSSVNAAAPKFDYTSNGKGGGWLMGSGGWANGDRAALQSGVFEHAGPSCKFRFAYYAYDYPPSSIKTVLNIYLKSAVGGTKLIFQKAADDRAHWFTETLELYTTSSFELQMELNRGNGAHGDISLDGFEFLDCSPDIPTAVCYDPTDFICADGSRCLHQTHVCDYTPDCRDGSDEDPAYCLGQRSPGSCDFETDATWLIDCRLLGKQQGDTLPWTSIEASLLTNGPRIDHTTESRKGHFVFPDARGTDVSDFEKATLSTQTVYPSNPTGSCLVRFYYYFYRAKTSQGSGKLKVYSTGQDSGAVVLHGSLSLGTIGQGTSSAPSDTNPWSWISIPVSRLEQYTLSFVAEIDDNPMSIIAIDDISFSKGCRTGTPLPAVNDTTECLDDQVYCEYEKVCIPALWICDGWCDCPVVGGAPGSCVDESMCQGPPTDAPPTPDNPDGDDNLSIILGATIGGVALIALCVVGFFVYRKYYGQRSNASGLEAGTGMANPMYYKSDKEELDTNNGDKN